MYQWAINAAVFLLSIHLVPVTVATQEDEIDLHENDSLSRVIIRRTRQVGNSTSACGNGGSSVVKAPMWLNVTILDYNKAFLQWESVCANRGYNIYKQTGGVGEWQWIFWNSEGPTEMNDYSLSAETQYSYYVSGNFYDLDRALESVSGPSPTATINTPPVPAPAKPDKPEISLFERIGNSNTIFLSPGGGVWPENKAPTSYAIYRALNGAVFSRYATFTFNKWESYLKYTDSSAPVGNFYQYRVTAINAVGVSDFSNTVNVTVPLARPSFVLSKAVGPTSVLLTWAKITGASHYVITRKAIGGGATSIAPVSASANTTALTYTWGGLEPASRYEFSLVARNKATTLVDSPASLKVTIDTSELQIPKVSGVLETKTSVKLVWSAIPGAVGYIVQQLETTKQPYTGPMQRVNTLAYTVKGLKEKKNYSFVVYAATKNGLTKSKPSNIVTVKTK